jgi:hypothetical protein
LQLSAAAAAPEASHATASQPPQPSLGEEAIVVANATATRVSQLPAAVAPASHLTVTAASQPPQPAVSEEVIGSAALDSQLSIITESNIQMFLKVFVIITATTLNVLNFFLWFCSILEYRFGLLGERRESSPRSTQYYCENGRN